MAFILSFPCLHYLVSSHSLLGNRNQLQQIKQTARKVGIKGSKLWSRSCQRLCSDVIEVGIVTMNAGSLAAGFHHPWLLSHTSLDSQFLILLQSLQNHHWLFGFLLWSLNPTRAQWEHLIGKAEVTFLGSIHQQVGRRFICSL